MANEKASSFLMKGIYLILVIVAIAIFINRIFSLNLLSAEDVRNMELRSVAMSNLNTLAGNEKCLAFKEKSKLENVPIELSLHSMIDFKKLEDFTTRFSDVEPECARDYKFGYRVTVETLPVNISSTEFGKKYGGVFGEILDLINGKKTTFVLDSSASMGDPAGPKSKVECLKDFMKGFIKELEPGSGVAIIVYGLFSGDKCRSEYGKGACCIKRLSDLVILDGNRDALISSVNGISATGNTPIALALEEGFSYSKSNNMDAIVLLTDGEEVCDHRSLAVEVANAHKNDGIVVYTVGLGTGRIDFDLLKSVAKATGGEFFDARTCEELVQPKPKEQINVKIPSQTWEFGSSVFSKDEAMKKTFVTYTPINIYFDESKILPAKIMITIVDGEMEKFLNAIEQTCSTRKPNLFSMFFSYPTYTEDGKICMDFPSGKDCQRIACEIPIDFAGIKNPGNYKISIQPSADSIKVIV